MPVRDFPCQGSRGGGVAVVQGHVDAVISGEVDEVLYSCRPAPDCVGHIVTGYIGPDTLVVGPGIDRNLPYSVEQALIQVQEEHDEVVCAEVAD